NTRIPIVFHQFQSTLLFGMASRHWRISSSLITVDQMPSDRQSAWGLRSANSGARVPQFGGKMNDGVDFRAGVWGGAGAPTSILRSDGKLYSAIGTGSSLTGL